MLILLRYLVLFSELSMIVNTRKDIINIIFFSYFRLSLLVVQCVGILAFSLQLLVKYFYSNCYFPQKENDLSD